LRRGVRVEAWQAQVNLAHEGDLAAFEELVKRFEDMAVGYAYSILGDFHLARDAAQEAFIQAWFDLRTLEEPRAFPAWLRRIVFKMCDRLTRRKTLSTAPLDAAGEVPDPGRNPLDTVEERETRDEVLSAVNALPEQERTATALFYINGYSYAEVGAFLEVPISTVKFRLHSARKKLRERMVGLVEESMKRHAPDEDFSRLVRKVLEGIGRIHWTNAAVLCFVGSVAACMRYLGEEVTDDYAMGISGGAFKTFWIPPWSPANCDLLDIGEEPVRRTFSALGYDYEFIQDYDRKNPIHDKEFYRRRIVESIDRGRPVMALGIVGPPECCVVTGYDKDGEVLYGRSYFQENQDGYFRAEDWYGNCHGLILVGGKREKPSERQILRDTLAWAIKLARTSEVPAQICAESGASSTMFCGLAAYDAMAEALLRDEAFPAGDLEALMVKIYAISNDGVCLLEAKRQAASRFLKAQAELGHPGAEQLREATAIYEREAEIAHQATVLAPPSYYPPEQLLKIAEPERRRELSRLVQEARALEERAVEHLERALEALAV
ncbi:MAG: sigma-70 family RNA polymerase sigma factor, partial [Bacteroidota bacterium]